MILKRFAKRETEVIAISELRRWSLLDCTHGGNLVGYEVLVHDEGEAIGPLLDHMSRSGDWLPIIAYAEEPAPRSTASTIRRGAGSSA